MFPILLVGLVVVKLLITHKEVFFNRKTYFLQNLSWTRVIEKIESKYKKLIEAQNSLNQAVASQLKKHI